VLDYRCQQTKNIEYKLHELQNCLQKEEACLKRLRDDTRVYEALLDDMQEATFSSEVLRNIYRVYFYLQDQIGQQEIVLQNTAANVMKQQKDLLKAKQEEKLLRKLKEKKNRQYIAERIMSEQRLLDELTIARFRYEYEASPRDSLT
jgi:flagellar export protein FliJ